MAYVATGTRSIFLNPTDALYGGIGIVGQGDILTLFSKSGATEELRKLVPFAKAKGARIVSVTSNRDSELAKYCDLHVFLPFVRELCPFDLSPVTSSAIQLLFGYASALGVMYAKDFSFIDYSKNIPASRTGKCLVLSVKDLMKFDDIPVCRLSDTLSKVMDRLSSGGFGALLILDSNRILRGVFTDGDLRRKIDEHGASVLQMNMSILV